MKTILITLIIIISMSGFSQDPLLQSYAFSCQSKGLTPRILSFLLYI